MKKSATLRKPTAPLKDILAANIRSFREVQHLSQEAFADACGIHRTYVGSVERSERNVTLSTLELFAAAMGTTVPDLLTQKETRK